jgi:hypothetical protein
LTGCWPPALFSSPSTALATRLDEIGEERHVIDALLGQDLVYEILRKHQPSESRPPLGQFPGIAKPPLEAGGSRGNIGRGRRSLCRQPKTRKPARLEGARPPCKSTINCPAPSSLRGPVVRFGNELAADHPTTWCVGDEGRGCTKGLFTLLINCWPSSPERIDVRFGYGARLPLRRGLSHRPPVADINIELDVRVANLGVGGSFGFLGGNNNQGRIVLCPISTMNAACEGAVSRVFSSCVRARMHSSSPVVRRWGARHQRFSASQPQRVSTCPAMGAHRRLAAGSPAVDKFQHEREANRGSHRRHGADDGQSATVRRRRMAARNAMRGRHARFDGQAGR